MKYIALKADWLLHRSEENIPFSFLAQKIWPASQLAALYWSQFRYRFSPFFVCESYLQKIIQQTRQPDEFPFLYSIRESVPHRRVHVVINSRAGCQRETWIAGLIISTVPRRDKNRRSCWGLNDDKFSSRSAVKPQSSGKTQFISVSQSCPTLWDPMDSSTPGLSVHHQLPEFTQTHVHWIGDAIQPSHPLSSLSPPAFNLSQHQVFSNESALHIRWLKYWSFSFSISPFNEHQGLISFRMDWLDLLAVQGTLKSLLQHHSSKASIPWCSAFFIVQLSHP